MADNKVSGTESKSTNAPAANVWANPWQKAWADPVERIEATYEQIAKLHAAGLEQARKNVDEAARLAKESIVYAEQLSAQWRAMTFEALRRTAESFAPKG